MLTQYRQIAVQIETQEGIVAALPTSADQISVIEPSWDPELNKIDRNLAFLSLSPSNRLSGIRTATVNFQVEAAGLSGGLGIAPFDKLLRACGMRQHGDGSGPLSLDGSGNIGTVWTGALNETWAGGTQLDHLTVVTQATSTATLRALSTYKPGDPRAFFRVESGTATTGSLGLTFGGGGDLGSVTLAQAGAAYTPIDKPTYHITLSAPTGNFTVGDVLKDDTTGALGVLQEILVADTELLVELLPGFGYFTNGNTLSNNSDTGTGTIAAVPAQFDIPSLTITFYHDGNRIRLHGCRGTCTLTMTTGDRGLFNFSFQGGISVVETAASFAAAVGPEAQPPVFLNGVYEVDGTLNALVGESAVDFGRDVALPPDVNQTSGILRAMLTDRNMVLTADPLAVPEDAFSWINKAINGTSVRFAASWGTGGTGNAFAAHAPSVSYDISDGDRDGEHTYEIDGLLTAVAAARNDEFLFGNY